MFDIAGIGFLLSYYFNSTNYFLFNFNDFNNNNINLIGLIIIVILRGFFQTYLRIVQQKIKTKYVDNLRENLLFEIVYSPIERVNKLSRGNIIGLLMVDINRTVYALDSGVKTLQQIMSLIIYLFFLIMISKFISLALFTGLISCLLALSIQRSKSWELGQIQSKINSSLQRIVGDGLYGLKTIKTLSKENWLLEKFSQENKKLRNLLITVLKKQTIFNILRESTFFVFVIIFIYFYSFDLDKQALSALMILSYKFSTIISKIIDLERLCMNALPGYRSLIKTRNKLKNKNYLFFQKNRYQIEIKKIKKEEIIQFSWKSRNKFLFHFPKDGLNLESGRLNIITGKSGLGKTTLLDSIFGLISPQDSLWTVKTKTNVFNFHGIEGSKLIKTLIAYSPQNDFMFESTLYENLLLKEKSLISNYEKILINSYLKELGLNYILKKNHFLQCVDLVNNSYSPGEIKRICLIRNILVNKYVEFYDEPTSFLDKDSKRKVIEFLVKRAKSKIILLISHDKELINKSYEVLKVSVTDRPNLINLYK